MDKITKQVIYLSIAAIILVVFTIFFAISGPRADAPPIDLQTTGGGPSFIPLVIIVAGIVIAILIIFGKDEKNDL